VDGNKFKPYNNIPYKTVVKGDSKFLSIAAASVLAKTHRDELMKQLDKEFPEYYWFKNKGYPSKQHRQAIAEHGITKYHRKSYKLLDKQLSLNF
jgi:ribonuclease HII